jgi:hypothetical protein
MYQLNISVSASVALPDPDLYNTGTREPVPMTHPRQQASAINDALQDQRAILESACSSRDGEHAYHPSSFLPPHSSSPIPPPSSPHSPSLLPPPSSLLLPPSSLIPPPSSVLRPPSSVFPPPSSLRPLPSSHPSRKFRKLKRRFPIRQSYPN